MPVIEVEHLEVIHHLHRRAISLAPNKTQQWTLITAGIMLTVILSQLRY